MATKASATATYFNDFIAIPPSHLIGDFQFGYGEPPNYAGFSNISKRHAI
jgi:hypothetical protein